MVAVSEKLSLHPSVWNATRLVGVLIISDAFITGKKLRIIDEKDDW